MFTRFEKKPVMNNIKVGKKFEVAHSYTEKFNYSTLSKKTEILTITSVRKTIFDLNLLVEAQTENGDRYYTYIKSNEGHIICFSPRGVGRGIRVPL